MQCIVSDADFPDGSEELTSLSEWRFVRCLLDAYGTQVHRQDKFRLCRPCNTLLAMSNISRRHWACPTACSPHNRSGAQYKDGRPASTCFGELPVGSLLGGRYHRPVQLALSLATLGVSINVLPQAAMSVAGHMCTMLYEKVMICRGGDTRFHCSPAGPSRQWVVARHGRRRHGDCQIVPAGQAAKAETHVVAVFGWSSSIRPCPRPGSCESPLGGMALSTSSSLPNAVKPTRCYALGPVLGSTRGQTGWCRPGLTQ